MLSNDSETLPNRSSYGRLEDKGDTLMIEFEPTPTANTLHDKDKMGGYRDGEIEFALERTTVKSFHKSTFRAFDGTERGCFKNKGSSWVTKPLNDSLK